MNRFAHGIAVVAGAAVMTACLVLAGALPATASGSSGGPVTTAHAAVVSVTRAVSPTYVAPKRTLREGMRGSDVKAMQQRLAALKYYPGPADGIFGPDTLEAVWAFQEVQHLTVDGIVGPLTGRALVHPRTFQARYPRGGAMRVEISLTTRVLVLYQDNNIALISHVSTGGGYWYQTGNGGWARAVTPTGHFWTTEYLPGWITVPLGQMYNSVFFIDTSYAMHGDTYVPVDPVSHGCVRMPMDIAAFFHSMLKTPGTSVYIYN
jgi:peptidoglycan hydrolase-like protein with peptidoglycan-binding domain